MQDHGVFWRLEALSNRQLLERLGSMLDSSRRLMPDLIAHLGEVEVRRLHLAAACSSMFTYCLKLGMTEDEAYRRIEVARLARRYPATFPLLANGQLRRGGPRRLGLQLGRRARRALRLSGMARVRSSAPASQGRRLGARQRAAPLPKP